MYSSTTKSKDVYSARILSYWSFIGIIIPLLGLILASIAFSRAKSIDFKGVDKNIKKYNVATIKILKISVFITALVIALSIFIGVKVVYSISRAEQNEQNLKSCIYDATQGRTPRIYSIEELKVNECYKNYQK